MTDAETLVGETALAEQRSPVSVSPARRLTTTLLVAAVFTAVMVAAVWPGEMKLVAPLFCDASQPDAFVISDSYSPTPGDTVYHFSLYCVGERGDATEIGIAKPMGVLFLIHAALLLVVPFVLSRPSAIRASRDAARGRRADPAPGSTAGPFVA